MKFSEYTSKSKIVFNKEDAIRDIYFNGKLRIDVKRDAFVKCVRKTTICNHIRALHAFTWYRNELLFDLILYLISDSKGIVKYLRKAKNDKDFDKDWWKLEKVKPYEMKDLNDPFWSSSLMFKCNDIPYDGIASSLELISGEYSLLPLAYRTYKQAYSIIQAMDFEEEERLKKESLIVVLECIYLRTRLDNRVLFWEDSVN